MKPLGTGRMVVALGVLVLLAVGVWRTMEAGKYRQFTWLLLGLFAARVALSWLRSRRIEAEASLRDQGRLDVENADVAQW